MKQSPYVIRILVLDGDPEGIRMLDRSSWNGKATVFPRSDIQKVRTLSEYKKPGVYLLCSAPGDDGTATLYIGEGDPVASRIDQHNANKDFWTWAVFFTSSDSTLNKVHIQYLESELVRLAKEAKMVRLDNGNTPQKPTLSRIDQVEAEGFLENILCIVPLLGIDAFEKVPEREPDDFHNEENAQRILTLVGRGIQGTGYETSSGFVVVRGSTACIQTTNSIEPAALAHREELSRIGIIGRQGNVYVVKQDFVTRSPSRAARILLGNHANGREEWKDAQGRSMNQIAQDETPPEAPIV